MKLPFLLALLALVPASQNFAEDVIPATGSFSGSSSASGAQLRTGVPGCPALFGVVCGEDPAKTSAAARSRVKALRAQIEAKAASVALGSESGASGKAFDRLFNGSLEAKSPGRFRKAVGRFHASLDEQLRKRTGALQDTLAPAQALMRKAIEAETSLSPEQRESLLKRIDEARILSAGEWLKKSEDPYYYEAACGFDGRTLYSDIKSDGKIMICPELQYLALSSTPAGSSAAAVKQRFRDYLLPLTSYLLAKSVLEGLPAGRSKAMFTCLKGRHPELDTAGLENLAALEWAGRALGRVASVKDEAAVRKEKMESVIKRSYFEMLCPARDSQNAPQPANLVGLNAGVGGDAGVRSLQGCSPANPPETSCF